MTLVLTEETVMRQRLVAEAQSWIGTPYISNGLVKGKRGGTDCAMFILGVYQAVGLIPPDFDPRPYPAQWHVHRTEEVYVRHVLGWAKEMLGPPGRAPKPGDVVMFKIGHVHAHGAIITEWPNVIHAMGGAKVMPDDVSKSTTGKRALWHVPQRFFSFWG